MKIGINIDKFSIFVDYLQGQHIYSYINEDLNITIDNFCICGLQPQGQHTYTAISMKIYVYILTIIYLFVEYNTP